MSFHVPPTKANYRQRSIDGQSLPKLKSQPVAKWYNREQVARGTPRPWFRVPESKLKTHAQKRAERAVARWKAA